MRNHFFGSIGLLCVGVILLFLFPEVTRGVKHVIEYVISGPLGTSAFEELLPFVIAVILHALFVLGIVFLMHRKKRPKSDC